MSSSTDYLHLNDHKIFNVLRSTLPKEFNKAQNLLTVKDDILYTWDFQNSCVLTLNIKAARSKKGDEVFHQTLLPTNSPLFTPELIIANDTNTLLIVAGLQGVLVFELPERCPPYGAFGNNKEIVYCRSFSLHERILAFTNDLEVRQVRFHPGSPKNNHIIILTSDNTLRLCKIENSIALSVGSYAIGEVVNKKFPGTKINLLEEMGETAVDFDFSPPIVKGSVEINDLLLSRTKTGKKSKELEWPLLLLHGDGCVYMTYLDCEQKGLLQVRGPLPIMPGMPDSKYFRDFCSILCVQSTPPVVCIAQRNGTISHALLMPAMVKRKELEVDKHHPYKYLNPTHGLYMFETIEIELGLQISLDAKEYCCPIFLHKDLSRLGSYYATHETGVHSINIGCIENIHKFVSSEEDDEELVDLLKQESNAEYLVCTKASMNPESTNPIIGFSVSYDPMSILALLANGQLVTLAVISLPLLPTAEDLEKGNMEAMTSPLKQMLNNPFDAHIHKILKKDISRPILKQEQSGNYTQEYLYNLLQSAGQVFREQHFKKLQQAQDEIEKRIKALKMLKSYQIGEIERMKTDRQFLQEKAEGLAEKYEDIKDKQEELTKRCEKILILLSRKQVEPSNAEMQFIKELKVAEEKLKKYSKAIATLRNKLKYQEVQMQNWTDSRNKEGLLDDVQTNTIKSNLQDMTNKITQIIKDVNEVKEQLNL